MVIRLHPPSIDYDQFIDTVVLEQQAKEDAAYFNGIAAQWKLRIHTYLRNRGNPEVIQQWGKITRDEGEKFEDLYKNRGARSIQESILSSLRKGAKQICPACGEDGTPNTLDHYLPKKPFPELAITAANLSPMCDICQGKKGIKTVNAANERIFLHPYFDEFLDMQIVVLEFSKPLEGPSITLRASPLLDAAQSALVLRHISGLDLMQRYSRFFKDEYGNLLEVVKDIRAVGQNVREQLEIFRKKASRKSINSWGHILYAGIMADNDLVAYLEAGDIP
jgi:5-methylcytosine-specific restriction endonuclease McrA